MQRNLSGKLWLFNGARFFITRGEAGQPAAWNPLLGLWMGSLGLYLLFNSQYEQRGEGTASSQMLFQIQRGPQASKVAPWEEEVRGKNFKRPGVPEASLRM